jgi:hypothetical protein
LHEGPCKVWMEVPTLMILVKQILHWCTNALSPMIKLCTSFQIVSHSKNLYDKIIIIMIPIKYH